MKLVFSASEIYPYCKSGGLADVIYSLSNELENLQEDVCLVLPGYPELCDELFDVEKYPHIIKVGDVTKYSLWFGRLKNIKAKVCLVINHRVYGQRNSLYSTTQFNEFLRYINLSHAAAYVASGQAGQQWASDILHAHDWHCGLAFNFLDKFQAKNIARIFTIHNIAFAGRFPKSYIDIVSNDILDLSGSKFLATNEFSFLEEAIIGADKINTVSPNYAKELQGKEFGFGFEYLLSKRKKDFSGILNGVDYSVWHPEVDKHLPVSNNYNFNIEEKSIYKEALQNKLGLKVKQDVVLCSFTNRFTHQKLIDVIADSVRELSPKRFQFIFHGVGDKIYENKIQLLADEFPDSVHYIRGFQESIEHNFLAAADVCLTPSRFEPCGLNALYAMRYGAIPLARPVGGFCDSIDNIFESVDPRKGTGFFAKTNKKNGISDALIRIASFYKNRSLWNSFVKNAKHKNFSWQKSALQYMHLYQSAYRKRLILNELQIATHTRPISTFHKQIAV